MMMRAMPMMLAVLIFSFQIMTDTTTVITVPSPDQMAYAVFKGMDFSEIDKK
ncbi:hypothetical protein D3C74_364260 [compost metagenome]